MTHFPEIQPLLALLFLRMRQGVFDYPDTWIKIFARVNQWRSRGPIDQQNNATDKTRETIANITV